MNKWYKFLSEAVEKKSLQEITKYQLENTKMEKYLRGKDSDQLEELFDGKKRFSIPFEGEIGTSPRDYEMLEYVNQLREQGWTIDFSEPFGYASKIVKSEYGGKTFENKRKMKIGPLISALSPKAEEFWTKHNKFYTTETNQFYFKTKYMIVVSRVPIDILRMSDHDGWTSCHSPTGGYFRCAIAESVDGGAVAYVVKNEELEKVDLQNPEIFTDKERGIDGVSPISRLRIRRFVGNGSYNNLELAVPERRVYGNDFPNFYGTLAPYLLNAQKQTIESVKQIAQKTNTSGYVTLRSWNLTGGSYEDTSGDDLFEKFFETELEFTGQTGKETSSLERDDTEERVNNLIASANRRFENCAVYADVDWDMGGEGDAYVMFGGTVSVAVNKEIEFNPNWRTVRDLIGRMSESFDIITGDEIDVLEEPGKTIFEFRLGNEDGYTVDDLDNFIYEVGRLDNNIEEAIDLWVNILVEEGYIENPLADLEEQFESIKHFELSTDTSGAVASVKTDNENQPLDGVIRVDLRQLFNNIQNLTDLNTSNKYFEDFFRNVWSKWSNTYHSLRNPTGREIKAKITNNFINRLKADLDPQQSLFEIAGQKDPTAPVQRKPITEKTLYELGVGFEIYIYDRGSVEGRTIGFDFRPDITCEVKRGEALDPTSVMIFMKLVKFFDKNFKSIANFYRQKLLEIVNETYEEIIEQIKQKQPPKETYNPYNYRQERLTQQITTPYGSYNEYIGENKKMFKKVGKNWHVIK